MNEYMAAPDPPNILVSAASYRIHRSAGPPSLSTQVPRATSLLLFFGLHTGTKTKAQAMSCEAAGLDPGTSVFTDRD